MFLQSSTAYKFEDSMEIYKIRPYFNLAVPKEYLDNSDKGKNVIRDNSIKKNSKQEVKTNQQKQPGKKLKYNENNLEHRPGKHSKQEGKTNQQQPPKKKLEYNNNDLERRSGRLSKKGQKSK